MIDRRKIALYVVCFFTVMLGATQKAQACSICISAIEDSLLPPIYLWTLISILIYLVQSAIIPHRMLPIKTVPTLPWSLLVALGFFIAGAAIMGVGIPVLLLVPVIVLLLKSWIPKLHRDWPQIFIRRERWFSVVVMIVIGFMAAQSIHVQMTRTRVDFILEWPSASLSRILMKKMGEQGPVGMSQLREIAKRGSVYKAAEALTILAEKALSPMDVPLAIETLRKAYPPLFLRSEKDQWLIKEIESSLQIMSGMDLPDGSSPDEWEQKWKERSTDPTAKSRIVSPQNEH